MEDVQGISFPLAGPQHQAMPLVSLPQPEPGCDISKCTHCHLVLMVGWVLPTHSDPISFTQGKVARKGRMQHVIMSERSLHMLEMGIASFGFLMLVVQHGGILAGPTKCSDNKKEL